MSNAETSEEQCKSKYALQVAFQTMKERCQQLQSRLTAVEKENLALRSGSEEKITNATSNIEENRDEQKLIHSLQAKIEELTKQKSQLTHHVFMVASENRQLWNRLTKLTQVNKSLGNHLTNIMDTLHKHPPMDPSEIMSYSFKADPNIQNEIGNREASLEEISLKLINSFRLEKSELEQQYAEMVELQSSTTLNLQDIGFTYPEDLETNSLEHMKQHEIRLLQTKELLLVQQEKLKKTLKNMQKMRKDTTCLDWLENVSVKSNREKKQNHLQESLTKSNATQTSPPIDSYTNEKVHESPELFNEHSNSESKDDKEVNICPLCGEIFDPSKPFNIFHEHVLGHFPN